MVDTRKFSEFVAADWEEGVGTVGLSGGVNAKSTVGPQLLPAGTTAERPVPAVDGMIRFNTTLSKYEFYNGVDWAQFEDSADISLLIARLAAHTAGDGASMIGLEDQGAVSGQTVQDLAEADFIVKSTTTALANAIALSGLSTGVLVNETGTGNLVARSIQGTVDQIDVADGTGLSGNPTLSIAEDPTLPGSSYVIIPFGTTAQRPPTPTNGYMRYNTDTDAIEFFNNGTSLWVEVGPAATDNLSYITKNDETGNLPNSIPLANKATGFLANTTGTGALNARTITGTTNQVDVANGDGSANPVLSVSSTLNLPGTVTVQSTTAIDSILDQDDMISDSPTALATQQSIKAYVDSKIGTSGFGEMRIYTSNDTWSKPAGLVRLKVTVTGGGGGAGGAATNLASGGGGAGGTSIRQIEAASLSATETVTIGAGGSGGASGANGSAGGTSSFGSLVSATGGGASTAASTVGDGGVGGAGASGTGVNFKGGGGGAGHSGATSNIPAGMGGTSFFGGGARGLDYHTSPGAGESGGNYGGGGSGACGPNSGGNGAGGIIIVEEYF